MICSNGQDRLLQTSKALQQKVSHLFRDATEEFTNEQDLFLLTRLSRHTSLREGRKGRERVPSPISTEPCTSQQCLTAPGISAARCFPRLTQSNSRATPPAAGRRAGAPSNPFLGTNEEPVLCSDHLPEAPALPQISEEGSTTASCSEQQPGHVSLKV